MPLNSEQSKPVLTIFVPTRGRPEVLNQFGTEFEATKRENTKVVFIVDDDDPLKERYFARNLLNLEIFVAPPSERGMNAAMNYGFREYARQGKLGYAIGFMGDDHRPRTVGWDTDYLTELALLGTGFVYGDDMFQGERLPTQVAFTTDIGLALSYMAPPSLQHLNVDTFWRDLGREINRITYLPNVIVEHMHPLAGKAIYDKNYRAVNSNMMAHRDAIAYEQYHTSGQFAEDVSRVKMMLENGYWEPWHLRGL